MNISFKTYKLWHKFHIIWYKKHLLVLNIGSTRAPKDQNQWNNSKISENIGLWVDFYKFSNVYKKISAAETMSQALELSKKFKKEGSEGRHSFTLIRGPEFSHWPPIKEAKRSLESGALDHSAILTCWNLCTQTARYLQLKQSLTKKASSHLGIEPRTFGLEVQRAILCANGTRWLVTAKSDP